MVDWTQIGFAACLMVNLVDVMGTLFTAPVLVPYGQSLGASTAELASFSTVRFGLGIVSFLWMPRLADVKGTKVCVLVSVLGSSIAYAMQGNSHYLSGCARANYALQGGETLQLWEGHECQLLNGTIELYEQNATALGAGGTLDCISSCQNKNGVYFFLAGRALAGFFGGTQPILRSYVSEISLPMLGFGWCCYPRAREAYSKAVSPATIEPICFLGRPSCQVSSKIGDVATMRIGAAIASVVICLYGFASTEVWHILLLHGSMGVGLGLFVPAVGPTLQRYTSLAHPKKAAQASALPLFGMQIGQVAGQPLFSAIVGDGQDRSRMNAAWLVAGTCFALGAFCADLALMLINRHPVSKRLKYTPDQIKIMIETDAKETDVFIEDMCKKLRGMLTEGHPDYRGAKLFSGIAQRFIANVLDRSIPKLREEPEQHLQDVARWISNVGTDEEIEFFQKRFPHVKLRLPGDRRPSEPLSPESKDYT
ncbi:unnamed protein product [Durusdinium trenchii]|uniref:Uncharacterized protein n=1 Tax=Durusdinium trenchii TaxID=1381693 RepID=A0ABP0HA68_9DINO